MTTAYHATAIAPMTRDPLRYGRSGGRGRWFVAQMRTSVSPDGGAGMRVPPPAAGPVPMTCVPTRAIGSGYERAGAALLLHIERRDAEEADLVSVASRVLTA